MNLNKYKEEASETAIYPGQGEFSGLGYVICGLCGETGELFEVIKKIIRDDDGNLTEEKKNRLLAESGDICWYISQIFRELNSKSDSFEADLKKVQKASYKSFIGTKESLVANKISQQRLILGKIHNLCDEVLSIYDYIEINGCKEDDDYFMKISNKTYHIFITLMIFLKNIDISIIDVLQYNTDKLNERYKNNKIKGDGESLEER